MTTTRAFPSAYRYFKQLPRTYFLGDETYCELPYLRSIFEQIPEEDIPWKYRLFIMNHHHDLPETGDHVIIIYLSNEDHHCPDFAPEVHRVFAAYPPQGEVPGNVTSIPLGYNGDIPHLAITPYNNRSIDLFFSGRSSNTRQSFYKVVQQLSQYERLQGWKTYIRFTDHFRSGLLPREYARYLYRSKLTLAPEGYFHSPITFRLFEAARAGSIPISKPLPRTWYFQDYPGLTVREWAELPTLLADLTGAHKKLKRHHEAMLNHYKKYFSAERVARYIIEHV